MKKKYILSIQSLKLSISTLYKTEIFTKIFSGVFWLTFGSLISRLLISLAYIILARIFSQSKNGEYGMIKSTIDNFMIFATLGLGLTATKFISENRIRNKRLASEILGLIYLNLILLSVIIAIFLFVFRESVFGSDIEKTNLEYFYSVSIILFLNALVSVQIGCLVGLEKFRQISILNILQGIFTILGLTIGGYLYEIKGALIGNIISLVILAVVAHILLEGSLKGSEIKASIKNYKSNSKLLWKFAIPASISTLITAPTIWLLNMWLKKTDNGLNELGLYSVIIILSSAIQMIDAALGNVLLPIFLSKEEEKSAKFEFLNYFGAWILGIIISLPLFIYPDIVTVIIGNKYASSQTVPIFIFTILSVLIIGNRQGLARDLILKNKMWYSVFSMLQWSITTLTCFYLMGFNSGVKLSISVFVGYLSNLIIFVPIYIHLKISPSYLILNKSIVFIWLTLFLLAFVSIYEMSYIFKLPVFLLLILSLFYNFKTLYAKINKKTA